MKKEAKAVHILSNLLQRCDHEELENIFLLQAVLKEERGILKHLANCSNEDYESIFNIYESIKLDDFE